MLNFFERQGENPLIVDGFSRTTFRASDPQDKRDFSARPKASGEFLNTKRKKIVCCMSVGMPSAEIPGSTTTAAAAAGNAFTHAYYRPGMRITRNIVKKSYAVRGDDARNEAENKKCIIGEKVFNVSSARAASN